MNIFNKYEENKGINTIDSTLFWDFNYDDKSFDWNKFRATVIQRVIQYGRLSDFYAAFDIYGGIKSVAQIALNEVEDLSDRDLQFMCNAFNLKKENTKCFIKKQSRKKLLNY